MPIPGEHHPAFEEYCECIFELQEDDVDVIQARIADRVQVSRPAVSEMMRRLETEGLITTDAGIHLTDAGRALAERVVRRHRLAERFLTDVLQLSWAEAHHEAGRWEHVMSLAVEQAMDRLLGSPTTCPHGNPIPGSDYVEPSAAPLSTVDVGVELHGAPHPRGARVHTRAARIPRAVRAGAGHRGHRHRGVARRHVDARDRGPPRGGRGVRQRSHPGQCVKPGALRRPVTTAALVAGCLALGAGCATTIDSSNTTAPANTTTTVFVPAGTTDELLAQMLGELGGLSEAIVANSHQRDMIDRVDVLWSAASGQVAVLRPRLMPEFEEAIGLAHLGVERRRPADADKAFLNLTALVAALTTTPPTSPPPTGT